MALWAIIPVKPLNRGKSRLSGILSENERYQLNNKLLINTLNCIQEVPQIKGTIVISCDPSTLCLARESGATTVFENGITNINQSIRRATFAAKTFHPSMILILPADLPFINSRNINLFLNRSGNHPEIVIAPDFRKDGTNALLINPPGCIEFEYGVSSFKKHVDQAQKKGLHVEICYIDGFQFDIDLPIDYQMVLKKGYIL
jgi:2-phospho-L-lactate guanylyltransferase